MAFSSYSNDPRLKRPASNPPDAPDPKRPATLELRAPAAINGSLSRPNGVGSTTTSPMDPQSYHASIVDLKMQVNLQTIATMNLQLKYDHAESQVKTAQADFQAHSSRNHFATFPAMRETKTAAVERAKKAFKVAEKPLESARLELRRLIESLVELEQSAKAPSPDAFTRAEFEELRRDLNNVKNDISSFRNDLSNAREMIDDVKATHKASQDTTTKALEDVRRTIDSQATRMDITPPAIPPPVQVDPTLLARLVGVESDIDDIESQIKETTSTIAQHVSNELKAPKDALVEMKNDLQKTVNAVAELQQGFQATGEETERIREALAKGVNDQHTNAQTLQGCLDRLDKMEPLLDQAADKEALANVKDSLQTLSEVVDSVKAAQEKTAINGTKSRTTNGVTSGLAPFQPVLGGDDEDDVSPFHSRPSIPGTPRNFDNSDFMQMKQDIEGLKFNVQNQTNRYNNLLTDQLAQNILDNLGAVYPNLKEAERVIKSVTELQGRLGAVEANLNDISGRTGAVANRVESLDTKATAALHASGQDIQKIRNDLTLLSNEVDQHAKAVEAGRLQLQDHGTAIETTESGLQGVQTWIENHGAEDC